MGFTICHEDTEKAIYTLKPYNVYLSPLVERKLEVERDSCFQSSVTFLLENQFSMAALYKDGVRYLSREEEAHAMARASQKYNRSAPRAVLDIKETEHESIAFIAAVRHLVNDWVAHGDNREPYLNIPPPSHPAVGVSSNPMPSELNNFQKRLVHQVIEVEYPSLVTISQPAFIQIINYDEAREKAVQDQRIKRARERVSKQIGFRWVAEALAGGDLSHLDPYCFRSIMSRSTAVEPQASLWEFSDKLKRKLQSHRPILVGHNIFIDLIYFCRCFFGPLPDRMEDFQTMAHSMFPVLVDTKYMATHECGSINPRSSLRLHYQHNKYNFRKIEHEAGYDSLLTAQVFIKLSAQLRDGGIQPDGIASSSLQGQSSKNEPLKWGAKQSSGRAAGRLNLRTHFDAHEFETPDVDSKNSSKPAQMTLKTSHHETVIVKTNNGGLIPRNNEGFWHVYSNKLRVFGTEERVCCIG
ncbi:hypothetical protein EYZ11_002679 [Aspergillus tanneri]|uniref:Uncharacterized protein n=1 Tax=Aspergillus tanneri TaxID=1220188 RepID=A0A4S3JQ75_9EURO|nr:hypothetical protein EYZ11_002679 [Aspergillus tanneri]